jgi:hypothetical protein
MDSSDEDFVRDKNVVDISSDENFIEDKVSDSKKSNDGDDCGCAIKIDAKNNMNVITELYKVYGGGKQEDYQISKTELSVYYKLDRRSNAVIKVPIRHDKSYIQFNIQQIVIKSHLLMQDIDDKNGLNENDKVVKIKKFASDTGIDKYSQKYIQKDVSKCANTMASINEFFTSLLNMPNKDFLVFCIELLNVHNHHVEIFNMYDESIKNIEQQLENETFEDIVKKIKKHTSSSNKLLSQIDKLNVIANKTLLQFKKIHDHAIEKLALKMHFVNKKNGYYFNNLIERVKATYESIVKYNDAFIPVLKNMILIASTLNKMVIVY